VLTFYCSATGRKPASIAGCGRRIGGNDWFRSQPPLTTTGRAVLSAAGTFEKRVAFGGFC
jgi:hypothetical protein